VALPATIALARARPALCWATTLALLFCLLGAGVASGASWQALVVNDSSNSDSVTQIDTASALPSATVPAGELPLGIAITPDARTAYVVDVESEELTPLNLTTGAPMAEAPIDLADGVALGHRRSPNYIAISPDGAKAYISDPSNDQVVPVNLTTTPATVEAAIDVGSNPEGIAFSPDGTTAYVVDNDNPSAPNHTGQSEAAVTPIAVATNTPGAAIKGVGSLPFAIAIAPNGQTAYVTENGGAGKVYPISLPSGHVDAPIAVGASGDGLAGIAVTPDGSKAYVSDYTKATVVPIDLADDTAGTPIDLPGTSPYAVAITPDSKTVYVSNGALAGDTVTPISTATGTPAPAISVGDAPRGIVITPDQAPVANFTVSSAPAGSPTDFDASCGATPSCSSIPFGTIATYTWSFGDGSAEVTTSAPTVSHAYSGAGTYTATVTESDGLTSNLGEVFTGQTASSFGAPSAQASRSVIVQAPGSATGEPIAQLSTHAISFGEVGVGQPSAPQSVTLTNSGNAPLSIASVSIAGAQAADFALSADGCLGATVPAGASCSATVTFQPAGTGGAGAQLAFTDDASGSPHTLSLTGVGATSGTLDGQVLNGAATPVGPAAGVSVRVCPRSPSGVELGASGCQQAITASSGDYSFSGLEPGLWAIQVDPTSASLFGASANIQIAAGAQTQDFTLKAPLPLSNGVSFETPFGNIASGVPTVNWDQPFSFDIPVPISAMAAPNAKKLYVVQASVGSNSGAGAGSGGLEVGGAVLFLVTYDAAGRASSISDFVSGSTSPSLQAQAARATAARDAPGDRIARTAGNPPKSTVRGCTLVNQPALKIYTDSSGELTVQFPELTGGGLRTNRFSMPQPIAAPPANTGNRTFNTIVDTTNELGTTLLPGVGPYNTATGVLNGTNNAITGGSTPLSAVIDVAVNGLDELTHGAASIFYKVTNSLVKWAPNKTCCPTKATRKAIGVASDRRRSAHAALAVVPFYEEEESAESCVKVTLEEEVEEEEEEGIDEGEESEDSVYIDPSGTVHTRRGHRPISGARVVLSRAPRRGAPLVQVPNKATVMSPANRRNPDRSDAFGFFGWDVLPGVYEVSASHAGCRSAHTKLLVIPPPALDLSIALSCPGLHYKPSEVSLRARLASRNRKADLETWILTAHVSGRGAGRPVGVVLFKDGKRTLGRASVNSRTGNALLLTRVLGHPRLGAGYSGDGSYAASRAFAAVKS
jgi:DNA-binding beta-propeller fold protein YncE